MNTRSTRGEAIVAILVSVVLHGKTPTTDSRIPGLKSPKQKSLRRPRIHFLFMCLLPYHVKYL